MKCPDCGKRLDEIKPPGGEFACNNNECPANIELKYMIGSNHGFVEYYGCTQEEINKQKRVK